MPHIVHLFWVLITQFKHGGTCFCSLHAACNQAQALCCNTASLPLAMCVAAVQSADQELA